jgi:hypothetical protein
LVSQRTAPAILGWNSRRYIAFVRRRDVRHVIDGRLVIARLDDVLTALGLADAPTQPTAPSWNRSDVERSIRGGR